jgi:hypothetical protein
MPRYKLRTLLILLALGPSVLAAASKRYAAWKAERLRKAQPIYWMISTPPPGGYSQVPKTVGELEAMRGGQPVYLGIGPVK